MSKKTAAQRDAERRAEARRRSRLVAQGRVMEEAEDESEAVPAQRPSMSFLQRLFPPAAPLPGKPPPLSGFTYSGRMRPVVLGGWLIRQNLFAGFGMGILWAATYVLLDQYGQSLAGTIASFISFGSLVAAGWIGWRRPWFYGFVAALIGYLLYAPYFAIVTAQGFSPPATLSQIATYLATNGVLQVGIGALAGFYGGYLRRRLADPATRQAAADRRRR